MKWIFKIITAAALFAASVQTAQACWGELTCEKSADIGEITSYPAVINYRVTFNYSWMNDRCAVAYLTDSLLPASYFTFPQITYDGDKITNLESLFWVNNPATGTEHVDYTFRVESYEHCVSLSPFPPAEDGSVRLVNSAAGGAFWGMEYFDCESEVVCRPPDGYCNRTPGYWKTHSLYGPARYDAVWASITPSGADTTFFLSGQTYYGVLWTETSASSNGYYTLARAYIAAKLNQYAGQPTNDAVDAALSFALNFFTTNTPATALTREQRAMVLSKATVLDDYNNMWVDGCVE